jgi:hypothetical protein
MKLATKFVTAVVPLLLVFSTAHASLSVSPIADKTVNAGSSITVNVVATDTGGNAITLTSSLPAFATLNAPTTGTSHVVTSVTITPSAADVGAHSASITASANGQTATEDFTITVQASDANRPPRVTAPALETGAEGSLLTFTVTASDADEEAITSLIAVNNPTGSTFSTNGTTSGTFSWTPGFDQAGEYDVIFIASNAQVDSATTHISVANTDRPVTLQAIGNQTLAEGDSVTVNVVATDLDADSMTVTASLPAFATLNPPTTSNGTTTLSTTIKIKPGTGTAGTYLAVVTAMSLQTMATDSFNITVTAPVTGAAATATMIGAFNVHKKFICFAVKPVNNSFDLRNVTLSSVTMTFNGNSIHTVRPTHLATDCNEGDDSGEEDAATLMPLGHGGGGDDCEECNGGDDGEGDSTNCVPDHIMACFSMSDIQTLFAGVDLPAGFTNATIEGDLTGGGQFVATIGSGHNGHEGDADRGKGRMHLMVRPNPMNPKADILFTVSQQGHVRVAIYDLRGRLVSTLQDAQLTAGSHSITWDGSTRASGHAASGVYYVRVEMPGETQVQAITVLK